MSEFCSLSELGNALVKYGKHCRQSSADTVETRLTDHEQQLALMAAIWEQLDTLNERRAEERSEVPVADGILKHLNRTRAT